MTTVVMQYAREAPLADDELAALIAKLRTCFEVHEVAWLHAYLSLDRKTLISVLEARDAGYVQMVHRISGIAFAACHATTPIAVT
jgi:hypothetical protein